MGTTGYSAYDCGICQTVLVSSVVLCFLGDSPMHAEVTSTPNPGQSLNPCRICTLSCTKKKLKPTRDYVQKFLHINTLGEECENAPRSWQETRDNSYHLHSVATMVNMKQFDKESLRLGIKDAINIRFLTEAKSDPQRKLQMEDLMEEDESRLHNSFFKLHAFDGVYDTPVEVLHVILLGVVKYMARDFISDLTKTEKDQLVDRLRSFDCKGLNIDSLKPKYLIQHILSIVGRDFKVILQAAPFVFFDFMTPEKKAIWVALCCLTPLVFQTNIPDMAAFQIQIRQAIDNFLFELTKSTAQWVNKPKIHMLRHLPDAILRFGPASLTSTEKFESYNGVLRQASVHSNKLAPGRDIANAFEAYSTLKFVLSGGWIYDGSSDSWRTASDDVTAFFRESREVRRAMGYNDTVVHPLGVSEYPYPIRSQLGDFTPEAIPPELQGPWDNLEIIQCRRLKIAKHDDVGYGSFVVVQSHPASTLIGKVLSLWQVRREEVSEYYIKLQCYDVTTVDPHYNMRRLLRRDLVTFVNAKDVQGTINVQHNCQHGECGLDQTKMTYSERQATGVLVDQVDHSDGDHFIINSASLHNPALHWQVSKLVMPVIRPDEWTAAILSGLDAWGYPVEDA
ncbi:hypothetical protein PGTUg99_001875 [Puccinia graminis f. sp. tritici]|uniref:Uncharacterized protein n=1 Tax=Puccinia graminis f. sp. tritici TaxID=56615 RepID=A0A5B0SAF6_PUCGR|nr:hypothetical protein PGTUg99_001875 [Puccinia graminis f. sp. tritici]